MTAIVTGTDGRSYMHQMAGEAPVFVTEPASKVSAPQAAIAGHARLVAWLVPVEPCLARRARVRLPSGQIVEVAAEAVCSATNIARARIGKARPPAARLSADAHARARQCLYVCPEPQGRGALRGVAAQVEGPFAPTSAAPPGARSACTPVPWG
jgi:hypothetical protein